MVILQFNFKRIEIFRSKQKINLQNKIAIEGWGAKYLSLQNKNGHWGKAFYQPKWTSTHYTLLDLRNLCISPTLKTNTKSSLNRFLKRK